MDVLTRPLSESVKLVTEACGPYFASITGIAAPVEFIAFVSLLFCQVKQRDVLRVLNMANPNEKVRHRVKILISTKKEIKEFCQLPFERWANADLIELLKYHKLDHSGARSSLVDILVKFQLERRQIMLNHATPTGETSYCWCREGEYGSMIQCEDCKQWFHDVCVIGRGNSNDFVTDRDEFRCLDCARKAGTKIRGVKRKAPYSDVTHLAKRLKSLSNDDRMTAVKKFNAYLDKLDIGEDSQLT